MEKQTFLILLTVLLFTVSSAQVEKIAYFKIGGELQLRPTFPDPIKNILWKLKGDLVAEWVENDIPLQYFGRFKGRTTLDKLTGLLTMKNLSKEDEGLFTHEINNKIQSTRYIGKAIEEVPKPIIMTKPLACDPEREQCGLSCDGETKDAGPVTYSWREGDGRWEEKERKIDITKTATAHVKTYSCMLKNPISEKQSEPEDNPFYVESRVSDSTWLNVGLSLLVLVLVGGLVCLGWKYKDRIKKWIPVNQSDSSEGDNVNEMSASGAASASPQTEPANPAPPSNA